MNKLKAFSYIYIKDIKAINIQKIQHELLFLHQTSINLLFKNNQASSTYAKIKIK